jgi:hypothetical protein
MFVGFSLGIGLTTISIVFAQNTSTNTTTSSTVFAAINTDFITAIAGLVIAVATAAGAFAKLFHVEGKVGTAITMVADTAKATLDNRLLIKEGLQTTYEMLPEQAQKIVNRPLVKETELTKRVNEYIPKVEKAGEIADKWGKVVDARLKPPSAGG